MGERCAQQHSFMMEYNTLLLLLQLHLKVTHCAFKAACTVQHIVCVSVYLLTFSTLPIEHTTVSIPSPTKQWWWYFSSPSPSLLAWTGLTFISNSLTHLVTSLMLAMHPYIYIPMHKLALLLLLLLSTVQYMLHTYASNSFPPFFLSFLLMMSLTLRRWTVGPI